MKISLYVPNNANIDDMRKFLRGELGESRRVKSKATRKSVQSGLTKIMNNLRPGVSLLTDGNDIFVSEYDGI